MKVAIAHDHFLYLGGAERVLIALLAMYPQADVYLALAAQNNIALLKKHTAGNIITSPFNRPPLVRRFADWFKPFLYFWWESLDLSSYDLIISSSHSFSSKSIIAPTNVVHISYIHTPPRYLYDEYNETRWIRHPLARTLLKPIFSWMQRKDYAAAQRPNVLIANSKTVQERIKRYYNRDSIVIYPPVRIPQKTILRERKLQYFLCVSRLVRQKGVDLAVRTCTKWNLPLVVVGTGPQEIYLRSLARPTVRFLGFVPDNKIAGVYRKAKALLYCARDEDFGIVPVEAMAHGVPVIAHNSGGIRETVIDGKTGTLFDEHNIDALVRAIQRFGGLRFLQKNLLVHARRFSRENFKREFIEVTKQVL